MPRIAAVTEFEPLTHGCIDSTAACGQSVVLPKAARLYYRPCIARNAFDQTSVRNKNRRTCINSVQMPARSQFLLLNLRLQVRAHSVLRDELGRSHVLAAPGGSRSENDGQCLSHLCGDTVWYDGRQTILGLLNWIRWGDMVRLPRKTSILLKEGHCPGDRITTRRSSTSAFERSIRLSSTP